MKTQETININSALKIVKLSGEMRFRKLNKFWTPSGYCFYHPEKGFFVFEGKSYPYMPCGGKRL